MVSAPGEETFPLHSGLVSDLQICDVLGVV